MIYNYLYSRRYFVAGNYFARSVVSVTWRCSYSIVLSMDT